MPRPIVNYQEEMERMLLAADDYNAGPPGPTTSREKRTLPDDDDNGSDSVEEDNESDPGNENQADLDQTPSEKQLFVKRLAKRLKLSNARAADIEKFSKECLSTKLVVLYGETISLSEKVNRLTENLGPQSFKITKETVDNIRLIVRQIFFKPTVKDYKTGDTIKLLVIDRIRKSLIGIPKNLEDINPQAWAQVESKVAYEVTQLRGFVKKTLKKDSELEPRKQMKINALTVAIMGKASRSELHQLDVETLMRVALFRKVYQDYPGDDFWDEVDKLLSHILKQDKTTYEKAMTGLLTLDRGKYGADVVDTVVH